MYSVKYMIFIIMVFVPFLAASDDPVEDFCQRHPGVVQKVELITGKSCYSVTAKDLLKIKSLNTVNFDDNHYPVRSIDFKGFENLVDLELYNIAYFEHNPFIYLKNLEYLRITRHRVNHFHKEIFKGLDNLQKLVLGHSGCGYKPTPPLTEVEDEAFYYLKNLRTLYTHCGIIKFLGRPFINNEKLVHLKIYANLQGLSNDTFSGAEGLKLLFVRDYSEEKQGLIFPENLLIPLRRLEYLQVSTTGNIEVGRLNFFNNSKLRVISLITENRNKLISLHPDLFSEFSINRKVFIALYGKFTKLDDLKFIINFKPKDSILSIPLDNMDLKNANKVKKILGDRHQGVTSK